MINIIFNNIKNIFLIVLSTWVLTFNLPVYAQQNPEKEKTYEAFISKIVEEKTIEVMGKKQTFQKLELTVLKGPLTDQKITIENGNVPLANVQEYQIDDQVMVSVSKNTDGKNIYFISDYIRRTPLIFLFFLFITLTVIVTKRRGILSLLGMTVSFLIIYVMILPKISAGDDPVGISILGSMIIIPVSFFLSHGINKKTLTAVIGTLISLIITGILANIFVTAAHLTGFSSEEAGFLQVIKQGSINMKGLLLSGIIIGALGVLDDITISQSAIVFQLKEANNRLGFDEIYKRAMQVGQDHIASMVNTLILVYTGTALPLLLLFINNPRPFSEIVNYEIIAEEIVRTLVASIGLISSVPITTFIATMIPAKNK